MKDMITVVIPAFNHEKFISQAIESVLSQSYQNFKIIIIDDFSTDSTPVICEKYSKTDKRINFIRNNKNLGAHNSINYGITLAESSYISILNSDDVFTNTKIEKSISIINNMDVDLVFGTVKFIDAESNIIKKGITFDWYKRALNFLSKTNDLLLSILNENFVVTTSNMVFKRELWEKNGGFKNLRYCHDLEFLMNSSLNGKIIFDDKHTHVLYRVHEKNTIKETPINVWIEIASVIAATLVNNNRQLLEQINSKNIIHFNQFLKNKNLSNIISYLMLLFINNDSTEKYYEYLSHDNTKTILKNFF